MMVCVWGNVIVNNFTIPYSMYGSTEKYVEIEGGRQSNENHQKQRVMEHLNVGTTTVLQFVPSHNTIPKRSV